MYKGLPLLTVTEVCCAVKVASLFFFFCGTCVLHDGGCLAPGTPSRKMGQITSPTRKGYFLDSFFGELRHTKRQARRPISREKGSLPRTKYTEALRAGPCVQVPASGYAAGSYVANHIQLFIHKSRSVISHCLPVPIGLLTQKPSEISFSFS